MKLLSGAATRRCLIADEGYSLFSSDFDQIELRVVAALAQEQPMIDAAKQGISLHKLAAERLFGINYTEDQYKFAKNINFTWVYGGGPEKMAHMYRINITQARETTKRYAEQFPALVKYKRIRQEEVLRSALSPSEFHRYNILKKTLFEYKSNSLHAIAIKNQMYSLCRGKIGYIYTPFGRRLVVDAIKPYAVVNYEVQSTAADILRGALLRAMDDPQLEPCILLPIHDELLAQGPSERAERLAQRLARVMTTEFRGVPITASGKVYGKSWGHGYL